jgi:DNA-binding SARP family transcriptional activator
VKGPWNPLGRGLEPSPLMSVQLCILENVKDAAVRNESVIGGGPKPLGLTAAGMGVSEMQILEVPARQKTQFAARPGVRIQLLGGFEARWGTSTIPLGLGPQRLLAFLALRGCPIRRSQAAGALWPSTTEELATHSLRSVLWKLRRTGIPMVNADRKQLSLAPEAEVDFTVVAQRLRAVVTGTMCCSEFDYQQLTPAADLLPGWDDDWVVIEREGYRQLRLHARETLSCQLSASQQFAAAVEAGQFAVHIDPLRESANRALIDAYIAEGNRIEALRHYEWFRQLLDVEMGLEPCTQIEDSMAQLASRT